MPLQADRTTARRRCQARSRRESTHPRAVVVAATHVRGDLRRREPVHRGAWRRLRPPSVSPSKWQRSHRSVETGWRVNGGGDTSPCAARMRESGRHPMERGTRALVALLVRDIGHGAAISDDAGRDGARWASSCWVMTVQFGRH
jgi:hypothetical protein